MKSNTRNNQPTVQHITFIVKIQIFTKLIVKAQDRDDDAMKIHIRLKLISMNEDIKYDT